MSVRMCDRSRQPKNWQAPASKAELSRLFSFLFSRPPAPRGARQASRSPRRESERVGGARTAAAAAAAAVRVGEALLGGIDAGGGREEVAVGVGGEAAALLQGARRRLQAAPGECTSAG